MLLHAIALDAAMSVSAALARLARYGLWLDPEHPEARTWVAAHAERLGLSFDEAARRLARDPNDFGAAIRRQWDASVLWYSRHAGEVLHLCMVAPLGDTLRNALNLHEPDSRPPLDVPPPGEFPRQEGVVLDGGTPVAVSVMLEMTGQPVPPGVGAPPEVGGIESGVRGGEFPTPQPVQPAPTEVRAWPRLDAPNYAPARTPFDVTVGLAATQQVRVAGGPLTLTAPAGTTTIDITVELIADGVDALDGWSRQLSVAVSDPTSAQVTFRLVGRDPAGPEPVHLTTLEVRYVLAGSVCGTASRPLVIGPAASAATDARSDFGTPWLAQPATASPVTVQRDEHVADLTIEIAKPDRNNAGGRYVCRLYSPYPIAANCGPHDIDLGDDAKTFAKTIVEQIRQCAGHPIVDNALLSLGDLVAEKLPAAALEALREVALRVAPVPPAVLLVSAEPYVPWELARIEPPLDPARPPYLGAQALVGRWLRNAVLTSSPPAPERTPVGSPVAVRVEKPPVQPPAAITVRHMAVMAGMYKATSGLRQLPEAEKEANALVQTYDAVPLAASLQALKQLLDASLEHHFEPIGGADAVHFAGHGEYDPLRPDASVLLLSDGTPLSSLLFRSAKYGGDQQPLLFLNACMIGIGGEILGAMGGFPGNCLLGGFGGVLGALWEVDDAVAHAVALEFWQRAMPPRGRSPEPVAAVLRDLRAKYVASATPAPVTTYLAYVYYGHPRLTLQRTP